MKIINEDLFEALYNNLYERLEQYSGNLEGLGIENKEYYTFLEKLWEFGKVWEVITIIIVYHYTRKENTIIKFLDGSSTYFSKNIILRDVLKSLEKSDNNLLLVLPLEDYKVNYREIENLLPKTHQGKKGKIGKLLTLLGICSNDQGLLVRLWKEKRKHEVIFSIIVLLRINYLSLKIEIEDNRYILFKRKTPLIQILESSFI